jgi:hypothetical protein
MRPFVLLAIVTVSLGSLSGAALAEPPAGVKSDSPALQAAKANSLNRMSLGLYRSLRVSRTSGATALNASLKSAAPGAVVDQKLSVERAALANRQITSSAARSASQQLQPLAAANYGAMGLSPAPVPNAARMNKLH